MQLMSAVNERTRMAAGSAKGTSEPKRVVLSVE